MVSYKEKIELVLETSFKLTKKQAGAFYLAGRATNLDPVLLATLAYTESNFRIIATSPKGYKGIMQTPISEGDIHLDVLRGAKILQEKLRYAKGDLELALTLYKGGKNVEAKKQAKQVLAIYSMVNPQ